MQKKLLKKMTQNRLIKYFLREQSIQQFKRYLIIGFLSFFLEYVLFWGLFKGMELSAIISNTIAITTAFCFNFLMNRNWSFQSQSSIVKQLFQYLLLFSFNMMVSNVFIYSTQKYMHISPLISKVLIMGLIVIWNFVIYKKVIYKN